MRRCEKRLVEHRAAQSVHRIIMSRGGQERNRRVGRCELIPLRAQRSVGALELMELRFGVDLLRRPLRLQGTKPAGVALGYALRSLGHCASGEWFLSCIASGFA